MTLGFPIYLDHHATTPTDPRVLEAMLPYLGEVYGNASSSTHSFGWAAEAAVEDARERLARGIGAAEALGYRLLGPAESRLAGPKGNREIFLRLGAPPADPIGAESPPH